MIFVFFFIPYMMEILLCEQATLASAIKKALTYYKKDSHSQSRRTVEYARKRPSTLEYYWANFERNHVSLVAGLPENHPYLADEMYMQTLAIYDTLKGCYRTCKTRLRAHPDG